MGNKIQTEAPVSVKQDECLKGILLIAQQAHFPHLPILTVPHFSYKHTEVKLSGHWFPRWS